MFDDIKFANPEFFYLFIIIPLLVVWYILKRKKLSTSVNMSSLSGFLTTKKSIRQKLIHVPFIVRVLVLSFIILVLARPQTSSSNKMVNTEGIDITIALDISTSMLAEDFKPNRLEAAKKAATEFINARINDRIGLVVFSSTSFTQCPITFDHDVLKNLFKSVKSGMIEDGTAIGMGLATAVDRLKDSKAKSKVIILLTDGINNTGIVAPLTAAEIAKAYGVRVYTIGVGTKGKAPYPMQTPFGTQYVNVDVQIDEDVLRKIASTTNGKYFRAVGNKTLENIYKEIDKLEKTKIDESVFSRKTEEFLPLAIIAGALLLFEVLFRYFYLRKIP
jgi:Ca-activated chloride channel family protein